MKENSAKRKISVNNEIVAMAKYQQYQRHGISENVGNIIMEAYVSEDENNESVKAKAIIMARKKWRNGRSVMASGRKKTWHLIIAAYQQNEISA
jgi:hypothetical protein